MTTKLLTSTAIAHFLWQVDDKVVFAYGDEDDPSYFYLDTPTWRDMTEPKVISIVIHGRDIVNGR